MFCNNLRVGTLFSSSSFPRVSKHAKGISTPKYSIKQCSFRRDVTFRETIFPFTMTKKEVQKYFGQFKLFVMTPWIDDDPFPSNVIVANEEQNDT